MSKHVYLKITCVNDARVGLKPGRQDQTTEGGKAEDEKVTGRVQVHILQGEKRREQKRFSHVALLSWPELLSWNVGKMRFKKKSPAKTDMISDLVHH